MEKYDKKNYDKKNYEKQKALKKLEEKFLGLFLPILWLAGWSYHYGLSFAALGALLPQAALVGAMTFGVSNGLNRIPGLRSIFGANSPLGHQLAKGAFWFLGAFLIGSSTPSLLGLGVSLSMVTSMVAFANYMGVLALSGFVGSLLVMGCKTAKLDEKIPGVVAHIVYATNAFNFWLLSQHLTMEQLPLLSADPVTNMSLALMGTLIANILTVALDVFQQRAVLWPAKDVVSDSSPDATPNGSGNRKKPGSPY